MNVLTTLATSFGLSTAAGLNAYLPLLIVALLARLTHLIELKPPYDALTSWWAIGVLLVLLTIEVFVDKIPAVDTVNDGIQTFIRPAAGAILFAASRARNRSAPGSGVGLWVVAGGQRARGEGNGPPTRNRVERRAAEPGRQHGGRFHFCDHLHNGHCFPDGGGLLRLDPGYFVRELVPNASSSKNCSRGGEPRWKIREPARLRLLLSSFWL